MVFDDEPEEKKKSSLNGLKGFVKRFKHHAKKTNASIYGSLSGGFNSSSDDSNDSSSNDSSYYNQNNSGDESEKNSKSDSRSKSNNQDNPGSSGSSLYESQLDKLFSPTGEDSMYSNEVGTKKKINQKKGFFWWEWTIIGIEIVLVTYVVLLFMNVIPFFF